ncbi:MAG: hypothetical protein ABR579_00460, partial [Actinomycetota bacterium]
SNPHKACRALMNFVASIAHPKADWRCPPHRARVTGLLPNRARGFIRGKPKTIWLFPCSAPGWPPARQLMDIGILKPDGGGVATSMGATGSAPMSLGPATARHVYKDAPELVADLGQHGIVCHHVHYGTESDTSTSQGEIIHDRTFRSNARCRWRGQGVWIEVLDPEAESFSSPPISNGSEPQRLFVEGKDWLVQVSPNDSLAFLIQSALGVEIL